MQIGILRGNLSPYADPQFSPDSKRIITIDHDQNLVLVSDTSTGKEISVLRGHTGGVYDARFSPDGTLIVTAGNDKSIRMWDINTGKERFAISEQEPVKSARFSPDGSQIVVFTDSNVFLSDLPYFRTARVYEVRTGKELFTLFGHTKPVRSTAYSPDGSRIITTSDDQTARVWDARTGQQLAILRGNSVSTVDARYGSNGKYIAVKGDASAIHIYLTQIADLISLARTRLTRGFTCEERQTYLHENIACPKPTPAPTTLPRPLPTQSTSPIPKP